MRIQSFVAWFRNMYAALLSHCGDLLEIWSLKGFHVKVQTAKFEDDVTPRCIVNNYFPTMRVVFCKPGTLAYHVALALNTILYSK